MSSDKISFITLLYSASRKGRCLFRFFSPMCKVR
nr:MAG TPA: hypothetical protein [Caudoviricetes sp.]